MHRHTPGHRFAAVLSVCLIATLAACTATPQSQRSSADTASVERGKYLVDVIGCQDCHTPKVYTAQGPAFDTTRLLSGHPGKDAIAAIPRGVFGPQQWASLTNEHFTAWAGPWGVSFAANLTPHQTGIGNWTAEQFVATLRTGKRMGVGRAILPPMPWQNYAMLTDTDLRAVFAYLKSIPAVDNVVPAPVAPAGAGAPATSGTGSSP